ncbi:YitT family protein [Haploplasma axanthum]|uniref:Uncharacterized BCR, YitT family COG1284 n=1 Tax=Haploplasma axanthum TaxID=29552 RepID=A0A449BDK5_HAPAX|nr:YitT family protein [Haploplasma axanthum]VEU80515.1 Uncharacterized BCR, YitT family COG1284 [Haploplasma axanthum]
MIHEKIRKNELLNITLGVISVVIGYYFFYAPSNLITGGVTGVSIVFREVFDASPTAVSIFIFIANAILLVVGGLVLGKKFFFKTLYGTLFLPLLIFVLTVAKIPQDFILREIASNKLLISAIGGSVLTGLGLGLVFKSNATTGGMDVIQKILNHKLKVSYSVALYMTDGIMVAIGLLIFGIESTFYAIFSIIIAGIVIDKLMLTGKAGYTVFIVTNEYHDIKDAIYKKIKRGVTKISVVGGYSEQDKDMIICTITKNQLYNLKLIIAEIDPAAFTFITKTTESVGQGFN